MPRVVHACAPEAGDRFASYDEVTAHLDGLGLFHMDLGLDRVRSALDALDAKRLPCPVIQVVGTNGKGSTCAFLHSLAMAHGFRACLFTSPHFLSPTERIRIDARTLPESTWPAIASQAYAARGDLTYFEMLTVMAAVAFRDTDPDLLIFEAGLGGRYDATSALDADLVCFTPIDLDHTELLGPDIRSIAEDKARAMRPGVRLAVSAAQPEEALAVLRARAAALNIPLIVLPTLADPGTAGAKGQGACRARDTSPPSDIAALVSGTDLDTMLQGVSLGLAGPHQRENARTALAVWLALSRLQSWRLNTGALRLGLERAFVPGRLQSIPALPGLPTVILDGAHNPHGMQALRRALREGEIEAGAVVFACLADKNPRALAGMVRDIAGASPVFVPGIADNPRAMPAAELARLPELQGLAASSLTEALHRAAESAQGKPLLICGSLYLLADFFALYPQALCPPCRACMSG